MEPGQDGRVDSAVAPFSLRVIGGWLRVLDPATGTVRATPDEERQARLAAEARVAEAEAALQATLADLAKRRDEPSA